MSNRQLHKKLQQLVFQHKVYLSHDTPWKI